MNLDRVAAEIRPRTPFEALDLGTALVQAWWKPVYTSYLAVFLPLNILLMLIFWGHPVLGFFLAWWLKPLLARLPLDLFSRALFGDEPRAKEALKRFPKLCWGWLFSTLFLYRLDPARSFSQPVWQLEALRGTKRWKRASVLGRESYLHAVWLTLLATLLKFMLALAFLGFLYMMLPQSMSIRLDELAYQMSEGQTDAYLPLMWIGLLLAHLVIEPWYVAAGFALYLNRRIHLEGWDIEIVFRRFAARLVQKTEPPPAQTAEPKNVKSGYGPSQPAGTGFIKVLVLGLLSLSLLVGGTTGLSAQPTEAPIETYSGEQGEPTVTTKIFTDPDQALEETLSHPDLNHSETSTEWQDFSYMDGEAGKEDEESDLELDLRGLDAFGLIGKIILFVVLSVALALLGFFIYRMIILARKLQGDAGSGGAAPPPEVAFGLDIRPQALPADVPGQALALWKAGQQRQALALLYRGAVAQLVHQEGLPLKSSHTEGDCLTLSLPRLHQDRGRFFSGLTRAWQEAAYAHRLPSLEEGPQMCANFKRHFGTRP